MKRILCGLLLAISASFAWAADKGDDGTDMRALRDAVRSDKRAYVASTLSLTESEARKFWPIYESYQRSVDLTNRRRNVAIEGLIGQDRSPSDLYARNLANELLATDEAEVKARRALQTRVLRALPAKKAARYLQLEGKIHALQEYDIAAAFPLIR